MDINKLIRILEEKYGKMSGAVHRRRDDSFQVLISCILSQRTGFKATEIASKRLFSVAKTPKEILALEDSEIEKLIKKAGFYRNKTKTIKKAAKVILEEFNDKVPETREELLKIPGIGWKCSAVIMSYCFDDSFIPVDTHVEVISRRLALADEKDGVEVIREKLEKLVLKDKRFGFHLKLIHFGREICLKHRPKCYNCPFVEDCIYPDKNLNS